MAENCGTTTYGIAALSESRLPDENQRWALDTPLSGLVFPKKNEAILEAASL